MQSQPSPGSDHWSLWPVPGLGYSRGSQSQSVPGRSFCPDPPSTLVGILPRAPFAGLGRLPQKPPYPQPVTLAPFGHQTRLLRHVGEARIPAPSLGRNWQQLQEADSPSISGVTQEPSFTLSPGSPPRSLHPRPPPPTMLPHRFLLSPNRVPS